MTNAEREQLRAAVSECNSPKHRLIDILSRVESISPAQAKGLQRAIIILETWQNTGARRKS